MDGCGGCTFSSLGYLVIISLAQGVVLGMLEILLIGIMIIVLIKIVLKNNVFFNYLRIKVKILGLDIEIRSKEKSTPSDQD